MTGSASRSTRTPRPGADGLYVSMGWKTRYVTESWHRNVPVRTGGDDSVGTVA